MKRLMLSLAVVLCVAGLRAQDRRLRPEQASVQPAGQEARVALVIGNSAYEGAPLKNPVNDAQGVAEALRACKFEVTTLTNASKRQMEDAIAAFGERIRGGAVGLFYFAGHGVQVKGENYLIPIGAKLAQETDVPYESVDVGRVLDKMASAQNKLNILILDACRNNPFARSWHRGMGEKGLASMNAPTGTFIAYATAPGSTAADGSGEHGLYTEALLAKLREPGLELDKVFNRVGEQVLEASGRQQTPWVATTPHSDFYFVPLVVNPTGPTEAQIEATVWQGISESTRASDLEGFLKQFPNGNYARLAEAKLANLRRASEHVVVSNVAEPWKALQRDKLETKEEYAARVSALGMVKVGTATISVDNYDVDARKLVVPYKGDDWARPYVRSGRVVVEMNRAQLRQLLASGGSGTLAATFEVREGRPAASGLVLSTAAGRFKVPEEPQPFPGATKNAFGLWETKVQVGSAAFALVRIPAGSFRMGTPGNARDERAHDVTITKGFWLGKVPVTQGQWQAVMGNNPSNFRSAGLDAPAECVSWEDCQQFIQKLNGMQSRWVFRLPTEAEWEYACRAGTEGERYGNLDDIAWHNGNSGGSTHPVGQKQPNPFGLYDMLGNVWQWCEDWYGESYYQQSPSEDPLGPGGGQFRVNRGGSWNFPDATYVRAALRGGYVPSYRLSYLGFRLACVPAKTP